MIDHNIFIHGGFDQLTPNIPTDKILCLDLNKTFNSVPALFLRVWRMRLAKDIIIHSPNGHHSSHVLSQSGSGLKSVQPVIRSSGIIE